MGLSKRSAVADYWFTLECDYIAWYANTMSSNRFTLISSMFHVNPTIPRGQPGRDPWHKMSIDESMIGRRNRIVFIQYMLIKNTQGLVPKSMRCKTG